MKKRIRSLFMILIIISISLGCKLSEPQATPTAIPPTAQKAHPTNTPASSLKPEQTTRLPTSTQAAPVTQTPQSTPYSSPLSSGDPYSPELGNSGYDVKEYQLQLTLNPASDYILAHVSITATSTTQIEQVALDFIGFDIEQVTFLGQPAEYQRQANKLLVKLPAVVPPNKEFVLEIIYSGEPVHEASAYVPFVSHVGMIRPDNESLYVASEPDGSRYWFPCNDHPRDKATYRFELTVPYGMTGVAIGKLIGEPKAVLDVFPNGKDGEVFVWEHNYPVATAFVTVAVAKYERIDGDSPNGVPLRSYVFPEQKQQFEAYAEQIGEMIDWLSEQFGAYPFEEFGYVMVRGMGASLETQTMVILDTAMLNEETLVHEMAHMWFGDWVSLDSWGDIWRSEGFATYVQFLWAARNQPGVLESTIGGIQDYLNASPSGYPLNYPPREEMFGSDSYIKGAVVAHALREKMGDKAFYQGLRTYFERYGGSTASHAQFQAVMEEAAGKKLDEFFTQWFK
jgi:aminopeptidase N